MITEKELMKIVILRPSNGFFSVAVTKKELIKIVILRQLNRHYDQKSLYGITTVFFMFKVFSCTLVNGLINGQDKHNDNEKEAKLRHMTIILIHKSSNCCIFFLYLKNRRIHTIVMTNAIICFSIQNNNF